MAALLEALFQPRFVPDVATTESAHYTAKSQGMLLLGHDLRGGML